MRLEQSAVELRPTIEIIDFILGRQTSFYFCLTIDLLFRQKEAKLSIVKSDTKRDDESYKTEGPINSDMGHHGNGYAGVDVHVPLVSIPF